MPLTCHKSPGCLGSPGVVFHDPEGHLVLLTGPETDLLKACLSPVQSVQDFPIFLFLKSREKERLERACIIHT